MTNSLNENIQKWLELQKIIKEEITLSDISKIFLFLVNFQPEAYITNLKNYYKQYYIQKISIREHLENNQNIIEKKDYKTLKYEVIDNPDTYLYESITFFPNIIYNLKDNIYNLKKVIRLLEKNTGVNYNSIVDLLCHQFYEDITNHNSDEFLILITVLLKDLLSNMSFSYIYSFLDNTFLDKLLKSYIRRTDFKNYLTMIMKEVIYNVDIMNDLFMELNCERIYQYICAKYNLKSDKNLINSKLNHISIDNDSLVKKIKKSICYHRKKNKNDIRKDSYLILNGTVSDNSTIFNSKFNSTLVDLGTFVSQELENEREDNLMFETVENFNEEEQNDDINYDYNYEMTYEEILNRIQKSDSESMKIFYQMQLSKISDDKNIFTNKKLLNYIYNLPGYKDETLIRYKENYDKIKDFVDNILYNLLNNISTIPYAIRCICKLISELITRKFPKLNVVERNAFIGEFLFDKCLIMLLSNPDYNAIVTYSFLSDKTKIILATLGKIIKKISRGSFFDSRMDWNFTIFNHYIVEIMPEIFTFFDKLIDINLPDSIEDLLKDENYKYSYFNYYPKEIIRIDCICYSVKDMILLWDILYKNKKDFENDNGLYKAICKFQSQEKFLLELEKKDSVRKFMLAFRDYEKMINPHEIKLFGNKDKFENFCISDNSNDAEKVKYCIKHILKSLDIIDPKNYTQIQYTTDTENFFVQLNEIISFEEFKELQTGNKIRLNWFSLFLTSLLNSINSEYKENDFSLLFNELKNEEEKEIEFLKLKSNKVISYFGMLIRRAEKVLEQIKRDNIKSKRVHNLIKIEKFIKTAKIKVCIRAHKKDELKKTITFNKNKRSTLMDYITFWKAKKEIVNKFSDENTLENMPTIIITCSESCIHNRLEYLNELKEGNSNNNFKENSHADTILDFVKIFGRFKEIREEVESGENLHKIDTSLKDYLILVKEQLITSTLFIDINEIELDDILDEIENFIIKKIYRRIYPEKEIKKDREFYEEIKKLDFITPEHMDIKKKYINEKIWEYAEKELLKMDKERTPITKINCIINAVDTIVNCIRFCTGKYSEGYSLDDYLPILYYTIIKSKPKRFVSNINFIKSLLDKNKSLGSYGHYLANLESAYNYILEINHTHLNMSKGAFDELKYNKDKK